MLVVFLVLPSVLPSAASAMSYVQVVKSTFVVIENKEDGTRREKEKLANPSIKLFHDSHFELDYQNKIQGNI